MTGGNTLSISTASIAKKLWLWGKSGKENSTRSSIALIGARKKVNWQDRHRMAFQNLMLNDY